MHSATISWAKIPSATKYADPAELDHAVAGPALVARS